MSLSSNFIKKHERLAIYKRDNFTCVCCGKSSRNYRELSIDHIIPRSKGGTNDYTNLVTMCHHCNSVKQSLTISQFCAKMGFNKHIVKRKIRKQTHASIENIKRDSHKAIGQYGYIQALLIF